MPAMRSVIAATLLALPALAAADTFGGFSGVDRPYLVNQDRVCTPLKVTGGQASGAPACEKAGADVIAKLSIKEPAPQRGAKATFTAAAQGRTLTVSRGGAPVVTWQAMDPIGKIVDVYASQYDDRVAVAFNVRRLGKETVDVVAFDLLGKKPDPATVDPSTQPPVATDAPPEDPKVAKAVADARKAAKGKALAAWKAVLALDGQHSEARFRVAAAHAAAKQPTDALAQLEALATSTRTDAVEWLVEARYDATFAALRPDPKFRKAVGLDRKAATAYERLMGFGGQWEQTGTSCDKPDVKLVLKRDRSFALRVKTVCQGSVYETPFKGKWRFDTDKVVLMLPNKGKVTAEDELLCGFEAAGDEEALRCVLGKDLDFAVLPARR